MKLGVLSVPHTKHVTWHSPCRKRLDHYPRNQRPYPFARVWRGLRIRGVANHALAICAQMFRQSTAACSNPIDVLWILFESNG
jgi:hypothetical protein